MYKKLFLGGFAALILLPFFNTQAKAQHSAPKVDVGAQFSYIRFRDLDVNDVGFGGRITYNINDLIALEGEVNFFPKDQAGHYPQAAYTTALVIIALFTLASLIGYWPVLRKKL